MKVAVIGSGTMGAGIAQVAASKGHEVFLYDTSDYALERAERGHQKIYDRLIEKGKVAASEAGLILERIHYTSTLEDVKEVGIVIEAIIENLEIKKEVFQNIEALVSKDCILASNTSSLSIASIGGVLEVSERVIGVHFFNPAPLMPLVEIIPAVQTSEDVLEKTKALIDSWGKVTVIAKDTPGFIVNRVARPFYGEALRLYEEGVADFATIDWAMTELGGFRMGPFTLMDYIGNDVNYTVTETVFAAFYYDPRYKPSFTQKRFSEAGWLGRKADRGYYDYRDGAETPVPNTDKELGDFILNRILVLLMNEAIDAVHLNIASPKDIDLAMTKGVNYPKGLLSWANEFGLENVLNALDNLYNDYREDRYRASVLLRRMVEKGEVFAV